MVGRSCVAMRASVVLLSLVLISPQVNLPIIRHGGSYPGRNVGIFTEAFLAEAGAMVATSAAFGWLFNNAQAVWNSIQRWWGGDAEWKQIWNDYKIARNEIIHREKTEELKRMLVSDLREDLRVQYPQWAYKFN
eukprot:TRINITY_DN56970_c0_g1_i1.p1 TRINITY_DN56970_c0_g1~~TRINITY_DN56970_c0_g1_i1.p1  ORF type:complete len:134 (+),score=16.60 TRINITY_DN56970_c0_g1_i1:3-404(+)